MVRADITVFCLAVGGCAIQARLTYNSLLGGLPIPRLRAIPMITGYTHFGEGRRHLGRRAIDPSRAASQLSKDASVGVPVGVRSKLCPKFAPAEVS